MPEGHLIHHYAQEHSVALRGPLAVSSPQGRFPEAAQLDGGTLDAVEPYGKHLFYWWTAGTLVHVHLGLAGLFLHHDAPAATARPQVRLRMAGTVRVVDLIAPARCEIMTAADRDRIVQRLGSDPLRADADVEHVHRRLAATGAPIGTVLLDQTVIAGVGNVLRAEVLNLNGIHPTRAARSLDPATIDRLWSCLVEVMSRAAAEGRLLPAGPHDPEARAATADRDGRFVYRRETCLRCGTGVEEITLGGRTAYACPTCQPR